MLEVRLICLWQCPHLAVDSLFLTFRKSSLGSLRAFSQSQLLGNKAFRMLRVFMVYSLLMCSLSRGVRCFDGGV